MSSWFYSTPVIDEKIEKATSENLPRGEVDLALNLEICDLIRSKSVPAKDAMRSLKRRLLHKNPVVQLAALQLVDTCIKNGGSHFLQEIGSREFVDTLVLVLKPPSGSPPVNIDVKQLLLALLQQWSLATDGQLQLQYITKVYKQLKDEGFDFPAPSSSHITSSFVESVSPPEWVDSDTCMKSGTPFSFVNRKHHCRNCGGVYIQKYCAHSLPLPHYGINEPVRVCDDCYELLTTKVKNHSSTRSLNAEDSNVSEAFDDDLKRALELSLKEVSNRKDFAASHPVKNTENNYAGDDDDDEDMKAAIAASLADLEMNSPSNDRKPSSQGLANTLYEPSLNNSNVQSPEELSQHHLSAQPQETPPVDADEFSELETEAIIRYCQLVEDIQKMPNGSVLREGKLQQLNDSVSALRPKLARSLAKTIAKYDQLVDMHSKLTTVVRYYDNMLEQSLAQTYSHSTYHSPYEQQQYGGYSQAQHLPHYAQPNYQFSNEHQQPLHMQQSGVSQHSYYQQQPSSPSTQRSAPSQPQYYDTSAEATAPSVPLPATAAPLAQTATGEGFYPALNNEPVQPKKDELLIEL